MQLRIWAAALIFVGSYLPLSLILLAQDYKFTFWEKEICLDVLSTSSGCVLPFKNPKFSISIFFICLLCFIFTLFVLRTARTKRTIKVNGAKHVPAELMSYTLPYVVSFMGVGFDENSKFLGILIFLCWMFWITHKSGQIILNPVLVVFGWRLYEVDYSFAGEKQNNNSLVLSCVDIAKGDELLYGTMQDIMITRSLRNNKVRNEHP